MSRQPNKSVEENPIDKMMNDAAYRKLDEIRLEVNANEYDRKELFQDNMKAFIAGAKYANQQTATLLNEVVELRDSLVDYKKEKYNTSAYAQAMCDSIVLIDRLINKHKQ